MDLKHKGRRIAQSVTRKRFPLTLLLAALYGSRIGAEFLSPIPHAVGAILGIGLTLAFVIAFRQRLTAWAPALLLPYLLFPFQSPELALLCATAFLLTGFPQVTSLNHWALELGVFLLGIALFTLTLSPGIQPADGGEFQLVIAEWGVAHPPGYPLYTLLGGLFARAIPISDIAWRVNLFSAITAALTLSIVARTIRLETRTGLAGLLAAGTLMSASAFWTTATQASIRPMTALFTALMIGATLAYRRAVNTRNIHQERRALLTFGLAAGFGVTHHASLFFAGSVFALGILATSPRLILKPRRWGLALGGALLGASPWIYLLVRGAAGARLAPPTLTSWSGFWQHVLASGFAGDMFYYRSLAEILERLRLVTQIFAIQWHFSLLFVILAGLVVLLARARWIALTLGGAALLHTFVTATYRAPQTVEYLIPAYVCFAVLLGIGIGHLKGAKILALTALFIGFTGVLWSGWPTWVNLRLARALDPTTNNAQEALVNTPDSGIILANWHHVTPLWTTQTLEGLRPDVTVNYLSPRGSEPILETWRNQILKAVEQGIPVVTCSYYPEVFRYTGLTFSSAGPCWSTINDSGSSHAEPSIASFDTINLLSVTAPAEIRSGAVLTVDTVWSLPEPAPYGTLTAFLHLVDETGQAVAQVDQPFMAPTETPGMVAQRFELRLPRTTLPGAYTLMAGLYRPGPSGPNPIRDGAGQLRTEVVSVTVRPSDAPPVTAHPLHTPLDDSLRLAGYDYDLSIPGRARLYLHWFLSDTTKQTTWQLTVTGAEHTLAQGELSGDMQSGFFSTAYDIPDTEAAHGVQITVSGNAGVLPVRGAWNIPVQPSIYLPPVRDGARYIPLGDAVITAVNVNDSQLSLTLCSTLPQFQDITLKITGPAGQLDTPPLGGMLPSLKWGWGTTFTEQFPLSSLNANGSIFVALYDAFNSAAWPVFDPALAQSAGNLQLSR